MCPSEENMAETSPADFLKQAQQLKKLVDKHEKEGVMKKYRKRDGIRDCFCELQEFESTLNSERKTKILTMQQQLQKIRNDVQGFQAFLTDVMPTSSLIEKLKGTMSEIENSINTFKEHQHKGFETLLQEERICWQEICAIDKRIDSWTLAVKKDTPFHKIPKSKCGMAMKRRQEFPVEVQALETFLQQTGGRHGGWDQCDHQSFLKVWTKHRGKPSYRSEVKLYLSDKTEEDIRLHEHWYLEVCRLQDKKKEAIQEWRTERQTCVQHERQSWEGERTEKEVARQEALQLKKEMERKEVALRLEAWRKQRRQQKEQQEEQRLKEEDLWRKRLKEERLRQQEAKRTVKARMKERKEEEELRKLEEEVQERLEVEQRRKLAAERIKRIQARDLHKLGRNLQEKPVKEEKLEQRQNQSGVNEEVENLVSRDPSKRSKPIKQWEELKRLSHQEAELSVT